VPERFRRGGAEEGPGTGVTCFPEAGVDIVVLQSRELFLADAHASLHFVGILDEGGVSGWHRRGSRGQRIRKLIVIVRGRLSSRRGNPVPGAERLPWWR
jgi:hypothetical protein